MINLIVFGLIAFSILIYYNRRFLNFYSCNVFIDTFMMLCCGNVAILEFAMFSVQTGPASNRAVTDPDSR